jgi:hypothetical protein
MIGEKHIPAGSLWNAELAIDGGDGPVMLGRPMYFQRLMGHEVARSLAAGPADRSAEGLFGSWHPGVCLFVMGDMSLKALNNNTDRAVLSALAARNDGEKPADKVSVSPPRDLQGCCYGIFVAESSFAISSCPRYSAQ